MMALVLIPDPAQRHRCRLSDSIHTLLRCLTMQMRAWLLWPIMMALVLIPVGIFAGGLQQLDYALCPPHTCQALNGTMTFNGTMAEGGYGQAVITEASCMRMNGGCMRRMR